MGGAVIIRSRNPFSERTARRFHFHRETAVLVLSTGRRSIRFSVRIYSRTLVSAGQKKEKEKTAPIIYKPNERIRDGKTYANSHIVSRIR